MARGSLPGFDAPALAEPFEERVEQLRDLFGGRRPRYGEVVVHERCQGAAHLDAQLGASRRWEAKA